ncbi:DUF805 domain-containing protein [Gelidibacter mesophilus]|uniref:DUF805 domain-containing protein n=1 Tax=Gelidibacter mesophilus TaxID=169050 RepID=UPI000A014D44
MYFFHILIIILLAFLAGIIAAETFCLFWFIFISLTLALKIRKLHDTGKSGWFYRITHIPYLRGSFL